MHLIKTIVATAVIVFASTTVAMAGVQSLRAPASPPSPDGSAVAVQLSDAQLTKLVAKLSSRDTSRAAGQRHERRARRAAQAKHDRREEARDAARHHTRQTTRRVSQTAPAVRAAECQPRAATSDHDTSGTHTGPAGHSGSSTAAGSGSGHHGDGGHGHE